MKQFHHIVILLPHYFFYHDKHPERIACPKELLFSLNYHKNKNYSTSFLPSSLYDLLRITYTLQLHLEVYHHLHQKGSEEYPLLTKCSHLQLHPTPPITSTTVLVSPFHRRRILRTPKWKWYWGCQGQRKNFD